MKTLLTSALLATLSLVAVLPTSGFGFDGLRPPLTIADTPRQAAKPTTSGVSTHKKAVRNIVRQYRRDAMVVVLTQPENQAAVRQFQQELEAQPFKTARQITQLREINTIVFLWDCRPSLSELPSAETDLEEVVTVSSQRLTQ